MILRMFGFLLLCLSLNAMAEEACTGGWQFEQLKSCNLSCKTSVIDQEVYNPCRAEIKDDALGCGPEQYKSCPSMSCPGSIVGDSYTFRGDRGKCLTNVPVCKPGYERVKCHPVGPGIAEVTCKVPDKPASCRWDGCNVETWKSCKHSSCGVDEKNSIYKCTDWNKGYADSCGVPAPSITERESPKPLNPETDGRRAKDFYGTGSSCLTCNDIPFDSAANVQARFECLAKGINLAKGSTAGFLFSTTNDIIRNLQFIGVNYSFELTADQNLRLADILSSYTIDE